MELPEKYVNSMERLLGRQGLSEYLACFKEPRLYGLRVNTAKIPAEEFRRISPFKLTPVPWIPNGFYYSEEDKPAKHPYYFAGLYYLQEPSAMTPANVLPVEEGDRVLDLCAAPGGKSTELGARLNGTGLLVSNDVSASRAKALLKNIEVFGICNALVTCEYPEKLAEIFPEFFDKILVDAPCSGEGMFRKDGRLIRSWESQGPDFFAPIQRGILENAARMLKGGGRMVYSTCTFSQEENEDNIRDFLARHPEFELEKIYEYEGFARAFGMEEAVRLFPHRLKGEGHFVALLHRKGDAIDPENAAGAGNTPNGDIDRKYRASSSGRSSAFARSGRHSPGGMRRIPSELEDFLEELNRTVDRSRVTVMDERAYLLPEGMEEIKGFAQESGAVKGLRTMRSGLFLGELKKNRFEPSQALAMCLKCAEYPTVAELKGGDPNIIKYLKGETIEISGDGLRGNGKNILVAADGYPLGWGRLNGLTVKNRYLPGWRWI